MKATDLRIGNYISFGDSYVKVYEINENNFYCIDSDDTSLSSKWADLKPIELTEEWLLKMGFEDVYNVETGKLLFYRFKGENIISSDLQLVWFNTKIKYVHQLQNIFYAIKNQELTIK